MDRSQAVHISSLQRLVRGAVNDHGAIHLIPLILFVIPIPFGVPGPSRRTEPRMAESNPRASAPIRGSLRPSTSTLARSVPRR